MTQTSEQLNAVNLGTNGVSIVENCLTRQLLHQLDEVFPAEVSNLRNALEIPAIRALSRSATIRSLITPALGEKCFAVRAILFNKTVKSNWKVAWHQDLVIAVESRMHVEGFGPWSVKLGIPHVRPPAYVLESMLAARIHLDHCKRDSGPLRVLLGTHSGGILSDCQIVDLCKRNEVECSVSRGDVILMRPLLVHASSSARQLASRRVIHIEFASTELPPPLRWHDAIA